MVIMAPRNRILRSSGTAATANQGPSATEPVGAATLSATDSSSNQRGGSGRSKRRGGNSTNVVPSINTIDSPSTSGMDKETEDYRRKRERNNMAVKKSRTKSKMKTQETLERVNKLRAENEMLEAKIQLLSKELGFLKDLFMAHAGNVHSQALQDLDLTIFGEPSDAGLALMGVRNTSEDKTASMTAPIASSSSSSVFDVKND